MFLAFVIFFGQRSLDVVRRLATPISFTGWRIRTLVVVALTLYPVFNLKSNALSNVEYTTLVKVMLSATCAFFSSLTVFIICCLTHVANANCSCLSKLADLNHLWSSVVVAEGGKCLSFLLIFQWITVKRASSPSNFIYVPSLASALHRILVKLYFPFINEFIFISFMLRPLPVETKIILSPISVSSKLRFKVKVMSFINLCA